MLLIDDDDDDDDDDGEGGKNIGHSYEICCWSLLCIK
jgi:hypothetical protein